MSEESRSETPSRRDVLRSTRTLSRRSVLKGASTAAVSTVALSGAGRVSAEPVLEEVAVEMSDGVTIRGQVYFPVGPDGGKAEGQFPVVATFEPYKNGSETVSGPTLPRGTTELVPRGYVRAEFEVRGTGASEGRFRIGDEREELDYGELIYWLYDQDWCDGNVGLYGVSYKGLAQWMAARGVKRVDRPEQPLKALFPIVTGVDGYRDVLFNGGMYDLVFATFWLGLVGGSPIGAGLTAFDEMSAEEYQELQEDHVAGAIEGPLSTVVGSQLGSEEAYRNPEVSREHTFPSVVEQDIPAFTIQGWHDIFQPGNTLVYTQLQNLWAGRDLFGPMVPNQPVSSKYQCIVGPYFHTSNFGDIEFGWARLWFDRWLKGEQNGIDETDTPLHLFQTFGDRWVDARTWPLPDFGERIVETYYLHSGRTGTAPHSLNDGALAMSPPGVVGGSDAFPWRLYNPCNQGTNEEGLFGLAPGTRCTSGNREFEAGTLTYTTPPLEEGRNIAGPISASLYASTPTTNTSWVTALSVVAPDGSSTLVSKGQLLGSFRRLDEERSWYFGGDGLGHPELPEGADHLDGVPPAWMRDEDLSDDRKLIRPYRGFTQAEEEPVEPGVVERYDLTMDPAFARVKSGHRLRLSLRTTSSWAMPFTKDLDDVVGVYQIQRNQTNASYVNIPFVSGPLPESSTTWGTCSFNCGSPYSED